MKIIFLDFDGVILNHESYIKGRIRPRQLAEQCLEKTILADYRYNPEEYKYEYFRKCSETYSPINSCIEYLNTIIEQTGACIVVHSAWRYGFTVTELRKLLMKWGVHGKILDATQKGTFSRGENIRHWIKQFNQPIDSFVILDDKDDMEEYLPKLVQSTLMFGLTADHVKRAVEILNEKV